MPKFYGPTIATLKFRTTPFLGHTHKFCGPTPPMPFFDPHQNFIDPRHPRYLAGSAKTQPRRHLLVQSQQWKTRTMCEICSKLTIKTPERRQ